MRYFITLILLLSLISMHGQSIQRRAHIGARFSAPNNQKAGALVREVTPGSAMAAAGLIKGDLIVKINKELVLDPDRWSDLIYDLRAEVPLDLSIKRNQQIIELQVTLEEMPREVYPGISIAYEEVISDRGQLIRTIVSRPANTSKKLPALFLIGGLSCSSIELYPGRPITGWTQLLEDLVTKSGMVVMRMEKPGVGDSNGHCGCSTFNDDISAFRSALNSLYSKNYIDTSKVIIYGSSMGSALAPYFANEFKVAGVVSDGTFVKTWFEHMLEIERRILKFKGDNDEKIMEKINTGYIPLYYGMLIEKKSFAQVVQEKPQLASYNYHQPAHMYGRPVTYYHQVQDFNFAEGWEKLKVPVRIIRGTHDWIMSDNDNDLIMEILDKSGHQDHQLYRYPGLDHWNMIHEQAEDSFLGKPGVWEDRISQIIIDYAWEMIDN